MRVVEGTPFADKWVKQNTDSTSLRKHLPDASERAALSSAADEWLRDHRFAAYLPGQYAIEGHPCRYLLLESEGCEQVGFGAGAETRIDGFYSLNTLSVRDYCRFSPDPQKLTKIIRPLA